VTGSLAADRSATETLAYDLVVVGSGPAGEKAAVQVAYFGKSVALVEREPVLGGAAANTGTLPSKTLRETALMLSGFRARGLHGVDLSVRRRASVRDFLQREHQISDAERERVATNLLRHGVTLYHGEAAFVDPHTVQVTPAGSPPIRLRAEIILIATGTAANRPARLPFHDPRVYDSDTILTLSRLPATLAVLGAGVIGSEYACTFAALGVEVLLIDGRTTLLGFLDAELSASLRRRMEKIGISFFIPDDIVACAPGAAGLRLELASGRSLGPDALLVTVGREGNTSRLNLQAAGLAAGEHGLLKVDDSFRTSVPHIYAAGDVIGFPALASTAMEQARIAMVHAFDLKYKEHLAPILPYGIYTIPEVSMAGATEESLRHKGVDYIRGMASYGQNARGQIIADEEGFLKLLFRREDMRLLGVHVIGELASEIVHIGLVALLCGATADLFIQTCFNYPTLSELYKYATYDAMGRR
jgi:NAD(P) transhydrogenase